jgi:hypothetical protein
LIKYIERIIVSGFMIICGLLVGCKPQDVVSHITPTVHQSPTASPSPTSTITPSPTPLPAIIVLIAADGSDKLLAEKIQITLADQAKLSGFRFQIRPSLSVDDMVSNDFKWVIVLHPFADLDSLAKLSPDTDFLVIGIKSAAPADNLTVIGAGGNRYDHQGFLAGYISALITPDWRIGIIGVSDTVDGTGSREAYMNGARFYCPNPLGFCSPTYAPFLEFPLYIEMESDSSSSEWQAAADFLIQRGVETIFISHGAGDESLLKYLAQAGVDMILSYKPPDSVRENWVITLDFDLYQTFIDSWEDFFEGNTGQSLHVPLSIFDFNPQLISIGRMRLVEEMLDELILGYVGTGIEQ